MVDDLDAMRAFWSFLRASRSGAVEVATPEGDHTLRLDRVQDGTGGLGVVA
jgi:hypothetical protein